MSADPAKADVFETSEGQPMLVFHEVSKSFGPTLAVDRVSFDVSAGEVHGLVGENGAGKSTLIRVLAGDHRPDSGRILLDGREVRFDHPGAAFGSGIGFVHQIPMFVPNLSITENLLLGAPFTRRRGGLIDWRAEHQAAVADLAGVSLSVDPRAPLESLSVHERQLVAVARAMKRGQKVLVLDEVTASLSEPEVKLLHDQIRRVSARGVSILYVSHRLEEIFRIADRVTVLRDGRKIVTLPVAGLTQKQLARHIVGSDIDHLFERDLQRIRRAGTTPRLSVHNLRDSKLEDVSFDVNRGEIVGICGLGGSGRTRLLHTIYGLRRPLSGEILLDGRKQSFRDPADALAAGIAMVTEDRIADGFVATLPVWQNVTLPWARLFTRNGFLKLVDERRSARASTDRLSVRMPGIAAPMTELSGGNQQKAIFARWVTGPVCLLLLDEPTHGVDIKSKGQIYDIIRELAAADVAVLLASSELEEVEALCHRALLIQNGRLVAELTGREIAKDMILHMLLAGDSEPGSRHEVRHHA